MNWIVFRSKTPHIQSEDLKILNKLEETIHSKTPFVGTLKLRQETPEQHQKDLIQSDHPVPRKRPKRAPYWGFSKWWLTDHILDVFSGLGGRIELIPSWAVYTSPDASLEYPQRVFWNGKKIKFVKDF